MNKLISSLFIFIFILFTSYGQEKILIKANNNIYESQFDKASELLAKYVKKEGITAATKLLEIKKDFYKNNSIQEIEYCEFNLRALLNSLNLYNVEIPKYYLEIGLQYDSLNYLSNQINQRISAYYLASNNFYELEYFIKKYPLSNNITQAEFLRDSLVFIPIRSNPNIKSIEQFISNYPTSLYQKSANIILENLYYEFAMSSVTSEAFLSFLSKFPASKRKNEILSELEYIEWNKAKALKTQQAYERFIKDYPTSSYREEAQNALANIKENNDYEFAMISKTSEAFLSFLSKFPGSKRKNEILSELDYIEWNKAKTLKTQEAYERFIKDFPTSSYREEAQNTVATIEENSYIEAISSNSIEKISSFKQNFPKSKYILSIEAKLKDLKAIVIPFLGADRKYRLYDINSNQFKSLASYDEAKLMRTDHFLVRSDTLSGIVDLKGNTIIPVTYPCITDTWCGQYIVFLKGRYGLFSKTGIKIIDPIYNSINEIYDMSPYYSVQKGWGKNSKYGLIDTTGKLVLPLQYSSIEYLSYNNSNFYIVSQNGMKQLIKQNGEKIGKPYKQIWSFDSLYLNVNDEVSYGIMDLGGKEIFPLKWKSIGTGKTGEFIVSNSIEEYGIVNQYGKVLFQFEKVNYIVHLENDLYLIDISGLGLQMVYSTSRESFISGKDSYRSVETLAKNLYKAEIGNAVKLFNQNWDLLKVYNNVISQETLDSYNAEDYQGDYERDYEGDGGEYYDEEEYYYGCSNYITEPSGHLINLFNFDKQQDENKNTLILIYIDGKHGYLDKNLNMKLPLKYTSANSFTNHLASVVTDEAKEIINEEGKVVLKDYEIRGWDSNNPERILVSKEYSSIYAWYNKSTGELKPMDQEIFNYKEFNAFNQYTYKDVLIFETKTGEKLMDPNISFNAYYANQLINKAYTFKYDNSYNSAISSAESALTYTPNNPTIYGLISDCYFEQSNFSQALSYVNQGLDYKEDDGLLYKRIEIYKKLYEYSNAAEDYLTLAKSYISQKYDKSSIANYYFQAGYQYSQGKAYQESISAYTKGLLYDQSSSSAWAYNNRGVAYNNLGQKEIALKDYLMAVTKCKDSCSDENLGLYLHNAANKLLNLNRKAEACVYYKLAANKDSKYYNDYIRTCK